MFLKMRMKTLQKICKKVILLSQETISVWVLPENMLRKLLRLRVGAVIAKSFARIFYRNAINIGLLAIECDTDGIDAGDELDLDIKAGTLKNLTKGTTTMIEPLPDVMIRLLNDGGLIEHIKKNGDLVLG